MSCKYKLFIFMISVVLFSCQNIIVDDNLKVVELETDLSELFEHNISIELLRFNIITESETFEIQIEENFSDSLFLISLKNINTQAIKMYIDLYYNNKVEKTYSQFIINENVSQIGRLYAKYKYDRVFLYLDTNTKEEDDVITFLGMDVLDHFFKKVTINDVETKADAFLDTPMKFFTTMWIYDNLDVNKIPVIQYPFGLHYYPISTCNNAFGCYQEYLDTGDEMYLDWFYNNADWLISYCDENYLLRTEFSYSHEGTNMTEGWISSMAQGEALAVMCTAYHVSQDEKYLSAAQNFFRTMHKNTAELWCVGIDSEDYLWYEEYPSEYFCHVLNGKMFGMWGLWTYYCITRDNDALSLFQGGLASIIDNYPIWNYENADASIYCKHCTTPTIYHETHIAELSSLSQILGLTELIEIIDVFRNY